MEGTGKTTVARLMFRFLRAYGVLKQDRFVEVNALELKGEFVGHTVIINSSSREKKNK